MHILKLFVFAVPVLFSIRAYGAFEEKMPGARPAALGGAMTALADDVFSLHYNPAGLGFLYDFQAAFNYTELFSYQDLRYDWAGFVVPLRRTLSLGASYSEFGPDIYKEIETAIGFGWMIIPEASIGIACERMDLRILGYGSTYDWAGSIGLLGKVNECVWIGMQSRRLITARIGKTDESPEKSISMGMRISPKNFLKTLLEAGKESNAEMVSWKFGQEIKLFSLFIVRFGFHSYPDRLSGGIGFIWHGMRLDYAVITHQYLDLQQQFSLLISW